MKDEPVIIGVVAVEKPTNLGGRRRLICARSDGSIRKTLSFYNDEVLFSEGDLIGLTAPEVRRLHFCRDRDHLQREDTEA
jgi:hypothetical protein